MDRQQNNNPWAERLSQVSMPDSGEAWLAMETVLDREMPATKKREWRRWLLLILLLLLLIGVCHCPGAHRSFGDNREDLQGAGKGAVPGQESLRKSPARMVMTRPVAEKPVGSVTRKPIAEIPAGPVAGRPAAERPTKLPITGAGYRKPVPRPSHDPTPNRPLPDTPSGEQAHDSLRRKPAKTPDTARRATPPSRPSPVADSLHKKTPPPKDQRKEKEKGWMAGIGLNQLFPIGGQRSPYNSSGITGSLSDYLPVPMLRYYFNAKWYVQLEAQFNTPQAAKKDLVISSPPRDSLTATQQFVQHSTSLQQLFYFNLPLSVHYMPVENLNIGAGLQFSHLTDAIGNFDSSTWNIFGAPDTVNVKEVKSLKSDTLYQKIRTNEFRVMLDASYNYRRFILGVRYDQALSRFIQVQIAPGQLTQSRNSSLQLYIRYILWDGRRTAGHLSPK